MVVCPLGQKLVDIVTFSAQCSFYFFLWGNFFIKPFFTKTQEYFLQCPCPCSGAKSEASLALFLTCSQASQRLFDSMVYIFCCILEKMGVGSEFKIAVAFSCEPPLVSFQEMARNRFMFRLWQKSSSQERREPLRAFFDTH